ncbi:hypothetical protein K488DRAFT_54676 [Vararia minispora EC-137]|uniref:Uncharacterized protein n=1 Tax=Vararia minispora EC-137 TaxID=1314806 RepID=A0ACB8QF44_9AGAM|nr:hypothetical protein K488DRAFT_54676 [Vararia minispora EC-137]
MLLDSVTAERSDKSVVWAYYNDLLDTAGIDRVPLEIHQLVLRNAIPTPAAAKMEALRHYRTVHFPAEPHPYEDRMLAVVRNMRTAGFTPTLADYHWILDQFAATGHFVGAEKVLKEIHLFNFEPLPVTYGYVLQACASRAGLPSNTRGIERREDLLTEISAACSRVLAEMRQRNVPITSENVDLAVRVLRDLVEPDGFDRLVRQLYGIDMEFLDSSPMEIVSRSEDSLVPASPVLSTAALNGIVDSLGRQGRISKMVEAFEVLTQPLPLISRVMDAFDGDEDDDTAYVNPHLTRTLSAKPNSTTFNILLEHLGATGNAALARHYVLVAFHAELDASRTLRAQLRKPTGEGPRGPQIMLQYSMLRPLLHVANRQKELNLMRFVWRMARRSVWTKWGEIDELERWIAHQLKAAGEIETGSAAVAASESQSVVDEPPQMDLPPSQSSTSPEAFAKSSVPTPNGSVLHIAPPASRPPLNAALHMRLLRRERGRLVELMSDIENLYARTQQRIKERLGRRVWRAQNIFLRSEQQRTKIGREMWKERVGFWTREETRDRIVKIWGPKPKFVRDELERRKVSRFKCDEYENGS